MAGNASLELSWNRLNVETPLPNEESYPTGTLGALLNQLNADIGSVGEILTAHFNADNPHGVWNKTVLVDLNDVTIDGSFNETHVKRIGGTNATVTLDGSFTKGDTVYIDNVWATSGTVTITTVEGTIHIDSDEDDASHNLTGKGQMELVFDGTDWVITNLVS